MPEFRFRAIDAKGKVLSGTSSAADPGALAEILEGQGLFLMEAAETGGAASAAAAPAGGRAQAAFERLKAAWARRGGTSLKEIAFFTSQLSLMVRTALPLMESLDLLASQTPNPAFREILLEIARGVSEGLPMSAAFARHPQLFDSIYTSMLAAGEAGGQMDVMLDRLTSYLDFKVKMAQNVRSALVYPVVVITVAIAVVAFLAIFIMPTFAQVFAELNVELPLSTRIVIGVSAFVRSYWYVVLLAVGALYAAFRVWAKRERNARLLDKYKLRIPVVGELARNIAMTRLLRTKASLLESGVTILKALELSKEASGNYVFRDLMEQVTQDVQNGKGLSAGFAGSPFVPAAVVGMIATGERTGTLPEVINRVASYYEAETDAAIKNLFSAIEPFFILVLGVLVGGIAVSVMLPLLDLAQAIQ
jgi:type IV pilus assembly protein PilC